MPDDTPWMTSNQRLHHYPRRERTRNWRQQAAVHADLTTARPFPKPARIIAWIVRDSNRKYDPNNLNPTTKACIDGFIDAGLAPDDDRHHVIGPDHRHLTVDKHAPGVIFMITPYQPDHDGRPNHETL